MFRWVVQVRFIVLLYGCKVSQHSRFTDTPVRLFPLAKNDKRSWDMGIRSLWGLLAIASSCSQWLLAFAGRAARRAAGAKTLASLSPREQRQQWRHVRRRPGRHRALFWTLHSLGSRDHSSFLLSPTQAHYYRLHVSRATPRNVALIYCVWGENSFRIIWLSLVKSWLL